MAVRALAGDETMGIIPHHPGRAQLRGGQAGLKARVTGGTGITQQVVMQQYHGGGGADGRAPAAQRRLLPQQVDGGYADHLAAGQATWHYDEFEVAGGRWSRWQSATICTPREAQRSDALQWGRAGGQHHLYAAAHQGVDDGGGF